MEPPHWGNQAPLGAAPGYDGYGPPNPSTGTPAGFWIRAGARIVDTVVGGVLGSIVGIIGAILLRGHSYGGVYGNGLGPLMPLKIVLSLLGPLLYHSISESMSGASLGKLLTGLRVMSDDYKPASFGSTVIRSAAYYIDAFCFALPAYSSMQGSATQQRLGDKWAHTVVVRVAPGTPTPPLAGIAIGFGVWAVTMLIPYLPF